MRTQTQLLLLLLIFISPSITSPKSVIEPCNSSDSCNALLSYLLPWDSKLSEIASRFQLNVSDLLASNSIDPTKYPLHENQILPARSLIKVPVSCSCVDGIRRSVSTSYTVRVPDTVESISVGYGGLVSADQIMSINGIDGRNPMLVSGERLVIPLPCTCFDNSNNGVPTVYLSYVVQRGKSLSSIGAEYGTTVMDLEAINGLARPVIDPGDIVAVPITACSSANLTWYNESLILPNSSYALTANNCIKCTCGPTDLNIRCSPSGVATSCSHLQCKGTNLFIGEAYENQTGTGCSVSACLYRGHSGKKIFRSLVNYSQIQCIGNWSPSALPPSVSQGSIFPLITLPPSPSPSPSPDDPSSNRSVMVVASSPSIFSNSSDGWSLGHSSCLYLLLLEFMVWANLFSQLQW